ncbi:MAG: N-acetylmuramoyl-L-alanine amidase [Crocinitomicaceae bacterium]|nr:N-acetylmuramoyl-L-alanine amidase [Crocinitomicaceae bacterium]
MHKHPTSPVVETKDRAKRGKRLILSFLALTAVFIAATTPTPRNPDKTFTVVLDPGHGGKDPGNLGTGRHKKTEKDISLDVALEVGKYIAENYPEVEIIYTRKDDTFPTLKDRVETANKAKADLFISIHCNANDNKAAFGAETFVMGLHKSEESLKTAMRENASIYLEENHEKNYSGFDPKNPDTYIALSLRENVFLDQSLQLAKNTQDQFRSRVGRKDRGVKQAGYYVISFTNMPSVLIELGFLTNGEEEDFLQSGDGKNYMSSAIFRAFRDYKEKMETRAVKAPTDKPELNMDKNPSVSIASPESEGKVMWRNIEKGVKFQVQILTSTKPVDKNSPDFRGLKRVEEYISGGTYKYLEGTSVSFNEAKKTQQYLREMGFKDAFIVAFENGRRIDLNEAIDKTK